MICIEKHTIFIRILLSIFLQSKLFFQTDVFKNTEIHFFEVFCLKKIISSTINHDSTIKHYNIDTIEYFIDLDHELTKNTENKADFAGRSTYL